MISRIQNFLMVSGLSFLLGMSLTFRLSNNDDEAREVKINQFEECQEVLAKKLDDEINAYEEMEHNFSVGVHTGSF